MLEFLGEAECAERVRAACEAVIADDTVPDVGTDEIAKAILAGVSEG